MHIVNAKTKDGYGFWLAQNQGVPVVSIAICFRHAGEKSDSPGKEGLTALLLKTLCEGAGPWSRDEIKEYMLEHNIQLSLNASFDNVIITLRTPTHNFKDAMTLLRLILTEAHFFPSVIEDTKKQIIASLKDELEDEESVATSALFKHVFEDHPLACATETVIASLPKIEIIDLKEAVKCKFAKNNLVIAAAGDISKESLSSIIDQTFKMLPNTAKNPQIAHAKSKNMGQMFFKEMHIPQSLIYFILPGIRRNNPDFYAAYILNEIVCGSALESRLWHEIREKNGLAYTISTTLSYGDHYELIEGNVGTKTESVEEVLTRLKAVLSDVSKNGITQKEVDFVKRNLIGGFALNFQNTLNMASSLLSYQINGLTPCYINKRNQLLSGVTLDQINRAAKTLYDPKNLTIMIVGQKNTAMEKEGKK